MSYTKHLLFIIIAIFISCNEGDGFFDSIITAPYCSDVNACNFEKEEECIYAKKIMIVMEFVLLK